MEATINAYTTREGIVRTLKVEKDGNDVDITLEMSKDMGDKKPFTTERNVTLNAREAKALVFYLVKLLLPNSFIGRKKEGFQKKDKNDEQAK